MIRLLAGDCRDVLATLPAESVQCVVTSPPYFGLRDYQTGTWDGGDAGCDHKDKSHGKSRGSGVWFQGGAPYEKDNERSVLGLVCPHCGAVRVDRQIGLEATPDEYLATMVGVFREVRRVLRRDGVMFLNMGDSYRDKQLQMMPARLALALQADGWWLRSDIIWAKPNPMPESVSGSHVTRHMITLSDYERLSSVPSAGQRAGSVGASDLPGLPAREVSDRQTALPADREGDCDSEDAGRTTGGSGASASVLSFTTGASEQGEIRRNPEGQSEAGSPVAATSLDTEGQGYQRRAASDDEGRSDKASATPIGQQPLQANGQRQSSEASAACQAHWGNPGNRTAANGSGVAGDYASSQGALLLLSGEDEADAGSCDPVIQGWPAYKDKRGSGLSAMQLEEEQPVDLDRLVPCPGCSKCVDGYIVHLSAGRPTSAHEHVFLLTRSARYYYDADAVREELTGNTNWAQSGETPIERAGYHGANRRGSMSNPVTARNLRNVWTIATSPYPNAHFATYPAELAERCIKAGTSERGCCAACGKPWGRIVDKPKPPREVFTQRNAPTDEMIYSGTRVDGVMVGSGQKLQNWLNANPAVTTGWSPGCQCNAATVPCTVLDPFIGAGTTALVADRLQRDCIGIDLNTQYTRMAMDRCIADAPLFTSFAPAEPPEDMRMADLFTDMAAD